MTEISIRIDLNITNPVALRRHARSLDPSLPADETDWKKIIPTALINPVGGLAALDAKITAVAVSEVKEPKRKFWRMIVTATVSDIDHLVATAQKRYAACWYDHAWVPTHVQEALWEVLVTSNASPSPDMVGYEILEANSEGSPLRLVVEG